MRLQGMEWEVDFETGERLSLAPEQHLRGWLVTSGEWGVDEEGVLSGRLDSYLGSAKFGMNYEFEAVIESNAEDSNIWGDAGMHFNSGRVPESGLMSLLSYPNKDLFAIGPGFEMDNLYRYPGELARENKFHVLTFGDSVMAYIGYIFVFNQPWPYPVPLTDSRVQVGFGSKSSDG